MILYSIKIMIPVLYFSNKIILHNNRMLVDRAMAAVNYGKGCELLHVLMYMYNIPRSVCDLYYYTYVRRMHLPVLFIQIELEVNFGVSM